MIQIAPTPNYAGLTITGDYEDFDQLYEALHRIVGLEEEHPNLYTSRIRVLGLCYDLRHANMGNRDYIFKDHAFNEDMMKWMGIVGSKKNLYASFPIYYPEIIFIVMALNDFIDIYERKKAIHKKWDFTVQTVRLFQATVIQSLSETLPSNTFKLMLNNMSKYAFSSEDYFTQYLDELNIRFLKWNKEKRLKNISIMAKRIAEKGTEYQQAKQDILEVAEEDDCHPSEVHYYEEYPDYEEIDW